jgi:hypothetical protein
LNLIFRINCLGVEINNRGITIKSRKPSIEESEYKKLFKENTFVCKNSMYVDDYHSAHQNINKKKNNTIEEIQFTPKMTKRKRNRILKNESTNMKTPSDASSPQIHNKKRRLSITNTKITHKKLIL